MPPRLKQLWNILALDFSKTKLSWLFGTISVVLVLLAVGGISLSAVRLLRNLADSQGLVRVQYTGATAREELRKYSEDIFTATRSLATRPTLRRMASTESPDAIAQFLRRSCQAANADVCALFSDGKLVVQSGIDLPWKELLAVASEQGERFMLSSQRHPQPFFGASANVPDSTDDHSNLRVYVIRMMDDKLATRLTERVDMHVRLVSYRDFTTLPKDDFTQLHSAGLSDGRSAAARIKANNLFAASFPVFASTGEAVALLEVRLPSTELDASVQGLVRRLWITAWVLGSLAVLAAVILARAVTHPVRALTDAALRLGQGDFSTSIPVKGAAEVGALARTMEDMRRNLVDLTGALRRREAEAQAVLNGVIEGVFAVDKNRNITYLNAQAAKLFAVAPQDAIGKFCGDVLKPCSIEGTRPCDTHCPILFARQTRGSQMVEHIEPGSQRRTTIINSAAPVDGLQVQVIRDETDLEGVRRARDSVLANISHEFRTPLAAQLASIELLRDALDASNSDSTDDASRRELVMSLERGTHRLTRLIDNLLESVRIESGQLAIRKQTLLLDEVIQDARELLGSLFDLRQQSLQVDLPEDLPEIEGDALRLTQVFVNLLANANKYAPEGSIIRVGAKTSEGLITVWVDDSGPGVPPSAEGSIFNRFARGASAGDEPEVGGLGLGLWIVKSIVERHGGTVSATRTATDCTRFAFTLPIAKTPA